MKTEMYWIDDSLAILLRPRGGDWLEDEIQDWAREGIRVVVSLLIAQEVQDLNLAREATVCHEVGLTFFSFPTNDRSVPEHLLDAIKLVETLATLRNEDKKIGLHCRQGLGRAPLLAACLLVQAGDTPAQAWEKISRARGVAVPETEEQHEWLNKFADELQTLAAA